MNTVAGRSGLSIFNVSLFNDATHDVTCVTLNLDTLSGPQKFVHHGNRSVIDQLERFHGERAQNAVDDQLFAG